MHMYSSFWLGIAAGLITLSPIWADRDEPVELHPAEAIDMAAWLRLPDAERITIVEQYTTRRPRLSRLNERQAA